MTEGKMSQLAAGSLANRQRVIDKLLWFLEHRGYTECGEPEVAEFLAYVAEGHNEPGGRWGEMEKPKELRHGYPSVRPLQPVKPGTLRNYQGLLTTFFGRLVRRGVLAVSPLERLELPRRRQDQVQPFAEEHIEALLDAAKTTETPVRDRALILFLYDTGARVSEAVALTVGDLDTHTNSVTVRGKGDKRRTLVYSLHTQHALWDLLRPGKGGEPYPSETPLFRSMRGSNRGGHLTPSGVANLIHKLGERAGIRGIRCSPHTLRHAFAVRMLRNGADLRTLSTQLGHTDLGMTMRYLAIADADIAAVHRIASPVASLFRRK